jgi:hypothetical protein
MTLLLRLVLCGLLLFPLFEKILAQQGPVFPGTPMGGVSPATFRQEMALVREANPKFFRILATCTSGKPALAVDRSALPVGEGVASCRIVVLFRKNVSWTAPLQRGESSVDHPKMSALLAKHRLKIAKWYDADPQQDGLVIKPADPAADLLGAAVELSGLSDVTVVFLKSPK